MHHVVTSENMQTERGTAHMLDIPKTTVLKQLRSVIHMFTNQYQRVQMLHMGDHQQRTDFANEYLIRYDGNNDWPLRISWTDEAHFILTGNVNSKNCVH
ncbi:hypothetical protein TNCT_74841 [Trichonephila clavata]|uniref:Transposase n=1 Tax=Trichonephila clavata TaxID=2740835 RepID=A0A8X6LHE9_TRICU|nr:hypothetical protein TNCT_74841 [Trichonephila clavata]